MIDDVDKAVDASSTFVELVGSDEDDVASVCACDDAGENGADAGVHGLVHFIPMNVEERNGPACGCFEGGELWLLAPRAMGDVTGGTVSDAEGFLSHVEQLAGEGAVCVVDDVQ